MKERPIIFSAPMVRAILEGRKTQTRRIVKNPWADHAIRVHANSKMTDFDFVLPDQTGRIEPCKIGKPGDRLWVRESWKVHGWDPKNGSIDIQYVADNQVRGPIIIPESHDPQGEIFNKLWLQSCDDAEKAGIELDDNDEYRWDQEQSPCRTRQGIFMPLWASRIDLEITRVCVERLLDITPEECEKEGITPDKEAMNETHQVRYANYAAYAKLWESINGKGSWNANPWVWVIEFKRI